MVPDRVVVTIIHRQEYAYYLTTNVKNMHLHRDHDL